MQVDVKRVSISNYFVDMESSSKFHSGVYTVSELRSMWEGSSENCHHPPNCEHWHLLQAAMKSMSLLSSENAMLRKKAAYMDQLQEEKQILKAKLKALRMSST